MQDGEREKLTVKDRRKLSSDSVWVITTEQQAGSEDPE